MSTLICSWCGIERAAKGGLLVKVPVKSWFCRVCIRRETRRVWKQQQREKEIAAAQSSGTSAVGLDELYPPFIPPG